MISQHERFGYIGEIRIHTFRNYFPNDVPTAKAVFDAIYDLRSKDKLVDILVGQKKLALKEIRILASGHAEMLFMLSDPEIPDPDFADRTSGKLRKAQRKNTEDPVVSAHMVIDLNAKHDMRRAYPACIENVDFLPRTLIINYLNQNLARHLNVKKKHGPKNEEKDCQPRFVFEAPHAHTIKGALDAGGILKSVKWVQERIVDGALGDKAYPVEERRDIMLKVANRPTKSAAASILTKMWEKVKPDSPKKMVVTIEEVNSVTKTISVDLRQNDILSNFFIAQENFTGFSSPMPMCSAAIRDDLVTKMKAILS